MIQWYRRQTERERERERFSTSSCLPATNTGSLLHLTVRTGRQEGERGGMKLPLERAEYRVRLAMLVCVSAVLAMNSSNGHCMKEWNSMTNQHVGNILLNWYVCCV